MIDKPKGIRSDVVAACAVAEGRLSKEDLIIVFDHVWSMMPLSTHLHESLAHCIILFTKLSLDSKCIWNLGSNELGFLIQINNNFFVVSNNLNVLDMCTHGCGLYAYNLI